MHVGLVTACYEPVTNGVTRMVSLYRSHLEELGHQTTIFTLGTPSAEDEKRGIYRSPGIPLGKTGYFFTLRYSARVQTQFKKLDIIHCHHLVMGLEFAHRYGRCPILFTNHTRYDLYLSAYAHIPKAISKSIMKLAWPTLARYSEVIIVPADATGQVLRKFGVRQPIRVIPNGIELQTFTSPKNVLKKQDFGIPNDSVLLIYVGRISSEKNIFVLLKEFSVANKINSRLFLALIGTGPLLGKLHRTIQDLQLDDHVLLIGEVENHRLPAYLAAADGFVTASKTEVQPLTIIEAMAAGLPVIAVSSPGTNEIVQDGITGLLAQDRFSDLADKMIVLAANPALRANFGSQANVVSKQYDIRHTTSLSLSLYEELLTAKRAIDRTAIESN